MTDKRPRDDEQRDKPQEVVRESIDEKIERARNDKAFQARRKQLMAENREALDLLADR